MKLSDSGYFQVSTDIEKTYTDLAIARSIVLIGSKRKNYENTKILG